MLSAGDCIFKNSCRKLMAINLLGMKPVWSSCSRDVTTPFSCIANTFVKILMSLGSNKIGRYEIGSTGSLPSLSSKIIFAFDIKGGRTPLSWDSLKTFSKRGSRIMFVYFYGDRILPRSLAFREKNQLPPAILLG